MDENLTRDQANAIYKRLEHAVDTESAGDPPVYAVRLDATTEVDGPHVDRVYRVRVTAPKRSWLTRDTMLYVLETVAEFAPNALVTVENDGIAIG